MISILIPVYNWEVQELVVTLQRQCKAAGVLFEILVFEDGSNPELQWRNAGLTGLSGIIYQVFSENQGRARIRNLLAQAARYPYLLFLDCDSGGIASDFISNYLAVLSPDTVLYGGRRYQQESPQEKELKLHWRFGYFREQATVQERQREPYQRFMTNNFLIPKTIFQGLGFDERLRQYGHEDTLFGMELEAGKIPILHLDNPVFHLGLEAAAVFLEKNRQAMQNLAFLWRHYPGLETRLLKNVRMLRKWGLEPLVYHVLRCLMPFLRRDLLSGRPHLRSLDLFKLFTFLKYDRVSLAE